MAEVRKSHRRVAGITGEGGRAQRLFAGQLCSSGFLPTNGTMSQRRQAALDKLG